MEPWTGQGQDVLLEYAGSDFSLGDPLRSIWLYVATFCLAILTWFFCRLSGHLRFSVEKDVLRHYRQEFPRAPFDRTDPAQQKALDDDADARVNNILSTRKWAPRVLGVLIPLVIAVAFYWIGLLGQRCGSFLQWRSLSVWQ